MKNLFSFLFIAFGMTVSAQDGLICSKHKSNVMAHERSATLSLDYIDLTNEYDLTFYYLDVSLERTSTDISGMAQIHARALAPVLDTFLFELHEDLVISTILQNGTTPMSFTREGSAVIVPVSFVEDDLFFMEIHYGGTPPSPGSGALGGDGISNNFSGAWGNQVTWTLSEPFSAYEWFPCKQALGDKADSSWVFVTTSNENMAGSQGVLTDVVDVGGGLSRYEWKSSYPIDYYLISISVAEYVEYTVFANPTGASGSIPIQNFIYNNPLTLPTFMDEIDKTVDMMELYSDLFGLYPFELEKYGHCMAPFGGGMEHQTMTTQGYFVSGLTAHELAHQWFGDHVTCDSWADIWINEGFASYGEELYYEVYEPGEEAASMEDRHESIMSQPDGAVWVEDSLNPSRIFSSRLTYNKGAAIIHTLRFLIDDDALFFQTLKDFQTDFSHSTAGGLDFKEVAEATTGMDFTNFFNEWYFGEGFPTYKGKYNRVGNNCWIEMTQIVSASSVTSLFTNDLEILVIGVDGFEKTVRLTEMDEMVTLHSFTFPEPIEDVIIDPNNWIINNDLGTTEDENIVTIEEEENPAVRPYPNPATNQLYVEFRYEQSNYQIVSINGKVVGRGVLQKGVNSVDITDLSCGSYLIKHEYGLEKFQVK